MAFISVFRQWMKSCILGDFHQGSGAFGEKRVYYCVIFGGKISPDFIERCFVYISQNNTAACAAEDISVRVDMYTFGSQKCLCAIEFFDLRDFFCGDQLGNVFSGSACESAREIFHFGKVHLVEFFLLEFIDAAWQIHILFPSYEHTVFAENFCADSCESFYEIDIDKLLVKNITTDLKPVHAEFVEAAEPLGDNFVIGSPVGVGFYGIDLSHIGILGFLEDIGQMIEIEEWFASSDVNFGVVTCEFF